MLPTSFVKTARWMKKNASSMRRSLWPKVAGRKSDQRSAERHENHGDCGSPWVAALGQHARGEPSRSPFGTAMLRLLHDRSQAGEFDRRSRLRQRPLDEEL